MLPKDVLKNLLGITERLSDTGHSLSQQNVADIISEDQWKVCYEWFCVNARQYVIAGTNKLTAINGKTKEALLAKLHLLYEEAEQVNFDRNLNNEVLFDTLKTNRNTRIVAWISLAVSILALAASVLVPLCIG